MPKYRTIKVARRIWNLSTGFFEYKDVKGTFNTYKDAVKHFRGTQTYTEKQQHRFIANGKTYLMREEEI